MANRTHDRAERFARIVTENDETDVVARAGGWRRRHRGRRLAAGECRIRARPGQGRAATAVPNRDGTAPRPSGACPARSADARRTA
ncbi:hypothetical protein AB5J52_45680 [Streptomyces sp. R39]|uniref:Uncharacterized protein n=1 Tax=Streptomyces sp. R39 TaxID=3238631 RepID=A0AB39R4R1_9ACTN